MTDQEKRCESDQTYEVPTCEIVPGKVTHVLVFRNGMVATFNEAGEQMPQYQGDVQFAFAALERDGVKFGSYELSI